MNFAQAKRALKAVFGEHFVAEHAKREPKARQYRVFAVRRLGAKTTYTAVGMGSSWAKAVAMALASEVKPVSLGTGTLRNEEIAPET